MAFERSLPGEPIAVSVRPGIAVPLTVQPAHRPWSFAEFYPTLLHSVETDQQGEFRELVEENPYYTCLAVQELLREHTQDSGPDRHRVSIAWRLASLCRQIHGHESIESIVDHVKGMALEEVNAYRSLTFLAAVHLFTGAADGDLLTAAVKVAPEYAVMFVSDCVMREWWRGSRAIPFHASPALKKLDDPELSLADRGAKIAGVFGQTYGDLWLAEAVKMGRHHPRTGDVQYLRSGASLLLKAVQGKEPIGSDEVEDLRKLVTAALTRKDYACAMSRARMNLMLVAKFGDAEARKLAAFDIKLVYKESRK